jgi:hypothetical protein
MKKLNFYKHLRFRDMHSTRHMFFFSFIVSVLTSCATIMTKRSYDMSIVSNAPNSQVQIFDSIYTLPSEIKVKRSKNDLRIKLMSDSLTREFTIKSSPNPSFLYSNLLWMQVSPAAYLIDFTNQKRFYYGKSVYLDVYDSTSIIRPPVSKFYFDYFSKSYATNKRQLNLVFTLPWINSFFLKPQNEPSKSNTGFWGLSTGLEYFYKKSKYIGLTACAVMDFFLPVPAAVDISGEYDLMSSLYISLTDNFKFRRFTFGYGINYSKNTWDHRFYDWGDPPPPKRDPVKKSDQSIGFTFNSYHQFGEYLFMGLIYRPTLINVYPNMEFKYEHLISLDFLLKIKINR